MDGYVTEVGIAVLGSDSRVSQQDSDVRVWRQSEPPLRSRAHNVLKVVALCVVTCWGQTVTSIPRRKI